MDDLVEAIELSRRGVRALSGFDTTRAAVSNNLCSFLTIRYVRTGRQEDLTAAIRAGREAVGLTLVRDPRRGAHLSNLGIALRRQFERSGLRSDLAEAIAVGRKAVEEAAPVDRPDALSNLGVALRLRFESTGQLEDLDEAVDVSRSAVTGRDDNVGWLSNLGIAVQRRFSRTGQPADLDEAIDVSRRALAAIPQEYPEHARYLSNLAYPLLLRGKTGTGHDLDEAIDVSRRALAVTPVDHPERAGRLSGLSLALLTRFDRDGRPADLADAIEACRQAVEVAPEGYYRARYLSNLVHALQHQPSVDTDEVIALCREISDNTDASVSVRVRAARAWATLAIRNGQTESALEAFQRTIVLLPILAWHGLDRDTRDHHLSEWVGLAADAAACAVTAGREELAIELLEHGRSVFWTSLLHFRSDLSDLAKVDGDLANRLDEIRVTLDQPGLPDDPVSLHAAGGSARSRDERIALAQEWDELVERVRRIDGFDNFLAPTLFSELGRAAERGPVVVVNMSRYRCDALIVTMKHGAPQVDAIPLPDLSGSEAAERLFALWDDLAAASRPSSDFLALERARHTVHDTLEWLWNCAAEPILTALGGVDRIWWCPTGLLTFLPLHAAGRYPRATSEDTDVGLSVPARVTSSYTPTLTELLRARRRPAKRLGSMLAVGIPEAIGGARPLPAVSSELEVVSSYFPLPARGRQLVSEHATRNAVRSGMAEHSGVHLACHGGQNLTKPTMSGVLLWDGPLTVRELAEHDLGQAELAYLSACRTAVGGAQLPDEAIHPAAALQVAGYRHVIATLWSISDAPAPDVADAFYRSLSKHGEPEPDRAATALADAIARLRDKYPTDPTIWAPSSMLVPNVRSQAAQ